MSTLSNRIRWVALCLLLLAPAWVQAGPRAPEFPADAEWLNSPPLQLAQLRGRPVLLQFWTYGCLNCRRSIPWLKSAQRQFAEQLQVITVHTPERLYQRSPAAVARKLKDFEIGYPVLLDNDFAYWNAIGNRYWPTFYLLDAEANIVGIWAGAIHAGSAQAAEIAEEIRELVAGAP